MLAPRGGWVQQPNVHTIGGVTPPANHDANRPDLDKLVIEAHISPKDIDQVGVGQDAMIRFPAFNQRTTPQVHASVIQLDADITHPQDRSPPFFGARLRLTQQEVKLLGHVELKPGMPAEAFIRTHERSPISYLLQPLTDQIYPHLPRGLIIDCGLPLPPGSPILRPGRHTRSASNWVESPNCRKADRF